MGDRGNIEIRQVSGKSVFFYGHWSGSEMPHRVRDALARRQRWSDAPYLTRIIFDSLTKGHAGEETGFGIDTRMGDNEHDITVVDIPAQTVGFAPEKDGQTGAVRKTWTFGQFAAMADDQIDAVLAMANCTNLTCGKCGYCKLDADLTKARSEWLMRELNVALDPKGGK